MQRLVEERERQRLDLLIAALPPETQSAATQIGSVVQAAVLGHMGKQHDELRVLAGRKLAEQNVDLGNQREQIRGLHSQLDSKDAEIAELERARHKLKERLDVAVIENGTLKGRIAELEHEDDFQARMLAMVKEALAQ